MRIRVNVDEALRAYAPEGFKVVEGDTFTILEAALAAGIPQERIGWLLQTGVRMEPDIELADGAEIKVLPAREA